MQNSVGAFEAKTHFSQLIDRVMHGEEIFITKRGKPVAKIIPPDIYNDSEKAREAAIRLRALAKEMHLGKFDWDEWKNYRDIGKA